MDKVLDSFKRIDFSDMSFPMITIYDHPKDYPEVYAARIWETDPLIPTNTVVYRKRLEDLRNDIKAAGFTIRIYGHVEKDPVILESWIGVR